MSVEQSSAGRNKDAGGQGLPSYVWGLTIGLVTTLALLSDHLQKLIDSPLLLYLYVAVDLLWVEIVGALVLFLLRHRLAAILREADQTFESWSLWSCWVALALIICILYQSWFYAKGKVIRWRYHHRAMIQRAVDAVEARDLSSARRHLSVCSEALGRERCKRLLKDFERRAERGESLRATLEEVPRFSGAWPLLLCEIYEIDRDAERYRVRLERYEQEVESLVGSYFEALEALDRGDLDDAAVRLEEIHDKAPHFGAADRLLVEVNRARTNKEISVEETYLRAAQSLGIEELANYLVTTPLPDTVDSTVLEVRRLQEEPIWDCGP